MQEPVAPHHGWRFYAFGPFRLDPANRLLLRDGESLSLTGKVFDLLLYFVENADRLLTKDETSNVSGQTALSRRATWRGTFPRCASFFVKDPGITPIS
jgi:DNA-binding response OmpR family regulator